MNLDEAIKLINKTKIPSHSVKWADLGCGSGLFTAALLTLLPTGSSIYALDKIDNFQVNIDDKKQSNVQFIQKDITDFPLPFKELNGFIMANSLHYIPSPEEYLIKLKSYLVPHSQIVIVEYDTDEPAGQWVPYPISYSKLQSICLSLSKNKISKIGTYSSVYGNNNLYAALLDL